MQNLCILPTGSSGPLFPYFDLYLSQLREQGYAAGSLYEQIHILKTCDRWLKRTGRDVRDLDETVARECLRRVIGDGYGKNAGASTWRRLLAMLRRIGVTPEAEVSCPKPIRATDASLWPFPFRRSQPGVADSVAVAADRQQVPL